MKDYYLPWLGEPDGLRVIVSDRSVVAHVKWYILKDGTRILHPRWIRGDKTIK